MLKLSLFVAALVCGNTLAAPPVSRREEGCSNKTQRKAWNALTTKEKKTYLDAELCLIETPSDLDLEGATNKFEELQSTHHKQSYLIHFVGAFLPWHRWFIHAHETYLRDICDYKGPIPYWDVSLDAGKFSESELLDPEMGFGGNGVGTDRCIPDGPFVNVTNHLGPGYTFSDHCIYRNVNDRMSNSGSQAMIDRCLGMPTFLSFWTCIETGPHGAGHGGIGGLMVDAVASPGDPLFYLHHTWLDMVWAKWQADDPSEERMARIAGSNKPPFGSKGIPGFSGVGGEDSPPFHGGGDGGDGDGDGEEIPGLPDGGFGGPGFGDGGFGFDFGFDPEVMRPPDDLVNNPVPGDPGSDTTMGHILTMFGVVEDVTIADVMDIESGLLCYEYV